MNNGDLIAAAERILRPRIVNGRVFGDVGAAVLSETGRIFLGVSVDTPSWGLCAERSALAAMIAVGEYRFRRVVAVWKDPVSLALHILPPRGVCREFMRSIEDENLDSGIILAKNRVVALRDLLPEHAWPEPTGNL